MSAVIARRVAAILTACRDQLGSVPIHPAIRRVGERESYSLEEMEHATVLHHYTAVHAELVRHGNATKRKVERVVMLVLTVAATCSEGAA